MSAAPRLNRFPRLTLPAIAAVMLPLTVTAQQDESNASKTEAMQIGQRDGGTTAGEASRRAFLDETPAQRARPSLMQAEGDQIGRPDESAMLPEQITADDAGGPRMPQLTKAELEATLAQLTPSERRVLQQAVEGTDICDNPPALAAIVTLCRTRLETRSGEFASAPEKPLTSEERLLRGGVESNGLPSVEAVISRLARVTVASSDDFSNQAIASIALTLPPTTDKPVEEDQTGLGLGQETEALINAIVQQLGGQGGGR